MVGQTTQATAVTRDAGGAQLNGRVVVWSSAPTAVATVSTGGLVTGGAIGAADVTATSEGVAGKATLSVVAPLSFGPGTKVVGTHITAGLYRSNNSSGAFCYRERLSGFGGTSGEILANNFGGGPAVVAIASTDAGFRSSGCVTWSVVSGAITVSQSAPFGVGTFVVGTDIAAGLWRSNTAASGSCYWERLAGFSGTSAHLLANGLGGGPAVVMIASGDAGFHSSGCGSWAQVTGPITSSQTAPFGPGTFIVGTDIAPGTWRSDGTGSSCYWERLGGFSGLSADLLANQFGSAPAQVTITPIDQGFASSGCGTWSKIG